MAASPTDEQPDDNGPVWRYVRALDGRVRALEASKKANEAVASQRRWALPIVFSGFVTVLNLLVTLLISHH